MCMHMFSTNKIHYSEKVWQITDDVFMVKFQVSKCGYVLKFKMIESPE